MKTRIVTTTAFVILLVGCRLLRGQSPAPTTGGGKIGVLNIQAAIAATAEGKKAQAELQSKYQPRQQELLRQQQEIQTSQEQLQKQATTLSDDEQSRRRRELEEKNKLFTRASDDFNADLRADRQEVISRIGQKMVRLINDYAQQNGYSLVLDAQVPVVSSDQVVDGQIQIYYAAKDVDITSEIVKRYDSAHPASSTPALTTPTAPTTAPATRPPSSAPRTTTPTKPSEKPKQ